MMSALTMVGIFQRSWAYSISPFQAPLSPNKVIPLTVYIAEWNVCARARACRHPQMEIYQPSRDKALLYHLANFN